MPQDVVPQPPVSDRPPVPALAPAPIPVRSFSLPDPVQRTAPIPVSESSPIPTPTPEVVLPQSPQNIQPEIAAAVPSVSSPDNAFSVVQQNPAAPLPVSLPHSTNDPVDDPTPEQPKPKKTPSNKPIAAIVAALIICTLLIAGVVYLQLSKEEKPTTPQTINKVTKQGVTADTVLNDAQALTSQSTEPNTDFSDQALGL